MRPILFIHGFGGDTRQYQPIIRYVRRHGFSRFYEFSYPRNYGQQPISEVARQLDAYVRATVTEATVDCIAISQGGIIARYYSQHFHGTKIRRCVTLCAPHQGTLLAYFLGRPGARDVRPGSPLLTQLRHQPDGTRYFCVYTPFDLMIFPGWFAKLASAAENYRTFALAHPLVFRSRPILRRILGWLR